MSGIPGDGLWEPQGPLVLSKWPLSHVFHITLTEGKRPGLVCKTWISGRMVYLSNVHLSSNRRGGREGRKQEIQKLKGALEILQAQEPADLLLCGDFNISDDEEIHPFVELGSLDVWPFLRPEENGYSFDPEENTLARTISPLGTSRRIDRILLFSRFGTLSPFLIELIKEIRFGNDLFLSDHFPTQAAFEFHQNSLNPQTKLVFF